MSKKQAKFFCEFCDSEVPYNAKFCPKCGHFFLSVRCPVCGKTGSHAEFSNGCPQCGYAFNGTPEEFKKSKAANSETQKSSAKKRQRAESIGFDNSEYTNSKKRKRSEDALPAWVYIATFSVFVGIIAFLAFLLK